MKRVIALRPSPATVISCIALFVALGGVSYGVATGSIDSREIRDNTIRSKDLRNNNVRSRDLRNNDVRALDIRNRTLRGRDIALDTLTDDEIQESKLTQVPSALSADQLAGVAASEYARARQEPVHAIGAPGQPAFESGFQAAGGTLAPGFWKDALGVVHLQGSVVGGLVGGGPVFTLPAGYRPAGVARFSVATTGAPTVAAVEPDGTVRLSAEEAALDGLSFRATAP